MMSSRDDGISGKTPPIEGQSFLYGVNVIDFGDLRVSRGLTRRPFTGCKHLSISYDERERRVWCKDCETDVEPFDAFKGLVERFQSAADEANRLLTEAHEASKFALISRAAKDIDKKWRSKRMVPVCPHCHSGIWPEESLRTGSVGKEYDLAAKARKAKESPTND